MGKSALVQLFRCIDQHGRKLLGKTSQSMKRWVGYDQLTMDLITEAVTGADAAAESTAPPAKLAILAASKRAHQVLKQYKARTSDPIGHRLFHLLTGQIKAMSTNIQ